LIKEENDDNI
jgi:hypothetical protein